MTQTLQSPATSKIAPASAARFIVNDQGEPLYALIDYELYLVLQETIDEWYAGQRAAAYPEWLEDPSTARPWEEVKAEMIAE
jgi:hypothetical protein